MTLLVLAKKYSNIKERLTLMVQALKGKGHYMGRSFRLREDDAHTNYAEITAILFAFHEIREIDGKVLGEALDELAGVFYPNKRKLWKEAHKIDEQIPHDGPLNARPGA